MGGQRGGGADANETLYMTAAEEGREEERSRGTNQQGHEKRLENQGTNPHLPMDSDSKRIKQQHQHFRVRACRMRGQQFDGGLGDKFAPVSPVGVDAKQTAPGPAVSSEDEHNCALLTQHSCESRVPGSSNRTCQTPRLGILIAKLCALLTGRRHSGNVTKHQWQGNVGGEFGSGSETIRISGPLRRSTMERKIGTHSRVAQHS